MGVGWEGAWREWEGGGIRNLDWYFFKYPINKKEKSSHKKLSQFAQELG